MPVRKCVLGEQEQPPADPDRVDKVSSQAVYKLDERRNALTETAMRGSPPRMALRGSPQSKFTNWLKIYAWSLHELHSPSG